METNAKMSEPDEKTQPPVVNVRELLRSTAKVLTVTMGIAILVGGTAAALALLWKDVENPNGFLAWVTWALITVIGAGVTAAIPILAGSTEHTPRSSRSRWFTTAGFAASLAVSLSLRHAGWETASNILGQVSIVVAVLVWLLWTRAEKQREKEEAERLANLSRRKRKHLIQEERKREKEEQLTSTVSTSAIAALLRNMGLSPRQGLSALCILVLCVFTVAALYVQEVERPFAEQPLTEQEETFLASATLVPDNKNFERVSVSEGTTGLIAGFVSSCLDVNSSIAKIGPEFTHVLLSENVEVNDLEELNNEQLEEAFEATVFSTALLFAEEEDVNQFFSDFSEESTQECVRGPESDESLQTSIETSSDDVTATLEMEDNLFVLHFERAANSRVVSAWAWESTSGKKPSKFRGE